MAKTNVKDVLKKIRMPGFLVPARILRLVEINLANANISFSAREWIGLFSAAGIILGGIVAYLVSLPVGAGLLLCAMALMFIIPMVQADKRRNAIEEALPDVLHHMSVAIRTGLVLESVIQEISESEYGAISEEFTQIMVEMRRGRPLKDALTAFSKRSGSKEIQRAMMLLLEGVESGGPISDVLDEVSDDMRAIKMVRRDRKSSTSQQVSFLAMASLIAGPFVMGVVGALPTIMEGMTAGMPAAQFPMDDIRAVVTALSFYVVAQAASTGIMIAVIMYGDFKKGFKFMIPMGIVAFAVFKIVIFIMPSLMTSFGG